MIVTSHMNIFKVDWGAFFFVTWGIDVILNQNVTRGPQLQQVYCVCVTTLQRHHLEVHYMKTFALGLTII